jgi:hypothetical protein
VAVTWTATEQTQIEASLKIELDRDNGINGYKEWRNSNGFYTSNTSNYLRELEVLPNTILMALYPVNKSIFFKLDGHLDIRKAKFSFSINLDVVIWH